MSNVMGFDLQVGVGINAHELVPFSYDIVIEALVEGQVVDQKYCTLSTEPTALKSLIISYFYMPTGALTVWGIQRYETQALYTKTQS